MKAVRIHAFGDESALTLDEIPVPASGHEDVLIRVVAASVNPVDWKIREGYLKDFIPHRLPLAKWRGADVIATASAHNADLVSFLGADEVIDYRGENFAKSVRGVDLVFDTVGGQVQHDSWATPKPNGMLVSIVDPPSQATAQAMGLRSAWWTPVRCGLSSARNSHCGMQRRPTG